MDQQLLEEMTATWRERGVVTLPGFYANDEVADEMDGWNSHIQERIARRGLSAELFRARKGDVFIWSADLLHGGSPINNPGSTRRSVVFHYFSASDSRAMGLRLIPESGGF